VVFGKDYIMRCSSAEWIARNGCALRWCHRGVGRQTEETVGFPERTAQLSVWKRTLKGILEACDTACQNCAVYSVFPSGMMSHSRIAQFNWECIVRFTRDYRYVAGRIVQRGVKLTGKIINSPCIEHNRYLFWESHEIHINTVWAKWAAFKCQSMW
jgi:hypothetical protein